MRTHLKYYFDFYIFLTVWLAVGFIHQIAALAFVAFSIYLFWKRQHYFALLGGFVFLLILSDNLDYFEFSKGFKNIYILFLTFVLLSDQENFKPFNKIFISFIPFILIACIGLIYAGNTGVSAMKTLSYFLLLMVVPNFMMRLYRENGKRIWADIAYFLIFLNLMGFCMSLYNNHLGFLEGRFRGLFGNPNGQGLFLYLSFAYFYVVDQIYPDTFAKEEKRWIYIIMIILLYYCGSRTAFISIFILVLFNWISFLSPYVSFLLLMILVFSLDGIFSLFVDLIKNLGLGDYFRIHTLEDGSGRFIAWAYAWQKIQDFFFVGGSMGNDEFIMRQNYRELAMLGHQGGVHNSYLTLWFDVGLIGLVFYFFSFLRLFLAAALKNRIALPMLYSVLFCITYESWLAGSLNPFTIILLMSITVLLSFTEESDISEIKHKNELVELT